MARWNRSSFFLSAWLLAAPALAQLPLNLPQSPKPGSDALTNPAFSADVSFLFNLESNFAEDTASGGGPAFAKWFAEDAVTLSDGKAPVTGRAAIAAQATWSPETYQLTWRPEGGRMGPNGDMGFTWGHYESSFKDRDGSVKKTSGRYMTVWKKQKDNSWKVALDASNTEPPVKEDCCKLP
ncbi:YybH family protein [Silvibacterium acidisoli]|uniref:YybH family protein n=1 Tax=Acidobacteriaceae bacterium ZG23-2 TaxID=2883246 RepID=UPI00406D1B75